MEDNLIESKIASLEQELAQLRSSVEGSAPRLNNLDQKVQMLELDRGSADGGSLFPGDCPAIPQLWGGDDPKPWTVEWEQGENDGEGAFVIFLDAYGFVEIRRGSSEVTVNEYLWKNAFADMLDELDDSEIREGWKILPVDGQILLNICFTLSSGTASVEMTIDDAPVSSATIIPVALANSTTHEVVQQLSGTLVYSPEPQYI